MSKNGFDIVKEAQHLIESPPEGLGPRDMARIMARAIHYASLTQVSDAPKPSVSQSDEQAPKTRFTLVNKCADVVPDPLVASTQTEDAQSKHSVKLNQVIQTAYNQRNNLIPSVYAAIRGLPIEPTKASEETLMQLQQKLSSFVNDVIYNLSAKQKETLSIALGTISNGTKFVKDGGILEYGDPGYIGAVLDDAVKIANHHLR